MSGTIINLNDERPLRAVLMSAQDLLYAVLPPCEPGDAATIKALRELFTEDSRRLGDGSTRMAKALGVFIEVLDRSQATPRAKIDALWDEIDAPWLAQVLNSPPRIKLMPTPEELLY